MSAVLKNIGNTYSMNIEKGYIWGLVNDYLLMVDETTSYKRISICISLEEDDKRREILADYIKTNKAYFKITNFKIDETYISLYFHYTVGLKKRMIEFISEFLKKLRENEVPNANVCCACLKQDKQKLKHIKTEDAVLCMHQNCFDSFSQQIDKNVESFKEENKNHITGAIGAVLGGLLGTIPWIIAFMAGYFVGWLGLLIGMAANKGYSLFKGKNSKLTPFIIIIVVIICVFTAQVLSEYLSLNSYLVENYEEKYSISEMTELIVNVFEQSAEYRQEVITNLLLGLLFAGLGIIKVIKSIVIKSKVPFAGMYILENQKPENE